VIRSCREHQCSFPLPVTKSTLFWNNLSPQTCFLKKPSHLGGAIKLQASCLFLSLSPMTDRQHTLPSHGPLQLQPCQPPKKSMAGSFLCTESQAQLAGLFSGGRHSWGNNNSIVGCACAHATFRSIKLPPCRRLGVYLTCCVCSFHACFAFSYGFKRNFFVKKDKWHC
jgi:hypothetical protein